VCQTGLAAQSHRIVHKYQITEISMTEFKQTFNGTEDQYYAYTQWNSTADNLVLTTVVVHVNGVRRCLWTAAINWHLVHHPGDIWIFSTLVNDIDSIKLKKSEKNLSQCHFVLHKSHADWHRHEPGCLRWGAIN
jgi:hypothetical protein